MKIKLLCTIFTFLYIPSLLLSEIHILYVSAVIPDQYEWRKREYLESLNKLKSYNIEPWIIEATNVQSTYFDDLVEHVLYPNQNDLSLRNQGVNEARSIIKVFDQLPFDDEDIVIKLTGRYLLYESTFIDTILANPEFDAYIKWDANKWQIFTGCFAMKWKHFKKMFHSWDLGRMESDMINFEKMCSNYIESENLNYMEFEKIFIKARIFAKGTGIHNSYL